MVNSSLNTMTSNELLFFVVTTSYVDNRAGSKVVDGNGILTNSSANVSSDDSGVDVSVTDSSSVSESVQSDAGVSSSLYYLSSWLWVLYIIIGVLGIAGNLLVALVLLRFTNMRRRLTNIYVINQSLIDLAASLFLLLTTLFQDQSLPPGLAGELKCRIWLSKLPFWASYFSSSINLVAITLERYMKIVHPVLHRNSFTKKRAVVSIVLIWVLGYAYNSSIIPLSGVNDGACITLSFYPSHAAKLTDAVTHFLLQYFLPIVAFILCYSRMALNLRGRVFKSSVAPAVAGTSNQQQQQQKQQQQHKSQESKKGFGNVVKTMFIVSLAFVICLSLNQWVFLFYNVGVLDNSIFENPILDISIILLYLNCCVNPIIYASTYQQFREAVKLMVRKTTTDLVPSNSLRFIIGGTTTIASTGNSGTTEFRLSSISPIPNSYTLSVCTASEETQENRRFSTGVDNAVS